MRLLDGPSCPAEPTSGATESIRGRFRIVSILALGPGQYPGETQWSNDQPADSLYVNMYHPRNGFVNRGGAVPTSWYGTNPWRCRCMLKPEWAPPLDNAHPQKNQSFISAGIYICLGDGSVRFVRATTQDAYWSAAETPDYGETIFPD